MDEEEVEQQIHQLSKFQSQIQKKLKKTFKELMRGEMHDPIYDISLSLKSKNQEIQELRDQLAEANQIIRQNKYRKEGQHQSIHHQQYQISENRLKNVEQLKKQARKEQLEYQNKVEEFVIFLIKCIRQLTDYSPQQLSQIPISEIQSIVKKKQIQAQTDFQTEKQKLSIQELKLSLANKEGEELFRKVSESLSLDKEWKVFMDEIEGRQKQNKQMKEFRSQIKMSKQIKMDERQRIDVLLKRLKKVLFYLQAPEEDHHILNQCFIGKKRQFLERQLPPVNINIQRNRNAELIPFIQNVIMEFYSQLHHLFEQQNQGKEVGIEEKNYRIEDEEVIFLIEGGKWEEVLKWIKNEFEEKMYHISRRMKFFTNKTKLINDLIIV